jgi:hypothetical protein
MAAFDTIGSFVANPSSTWTATTNSPGDTFGVRSFPASGSAQLIGFVRDGATKGGARVRSPRMHDNVTGINYQTSETPSTLLVPQYFTQNLYAQDTLIVEATGGTAEDEIVATMVYYSSLPGSDSRLHAAGDIVGNIKNIKSFATAVTASATIGTWSDTLITTTENQLHANVDYAVLGYVSDTSLAAVGIKGQETGNLRNCGPGTSISYDTSQWFLNLSSWFQAPMIPVFNSANRFSVYVSVLDKAASTTANVTLILAEMATNLSD